MRPLVTALIVAAASLFTSASFAQMPPDQSTGVSPMPLSKQGKGRKAKPSAKPAAPKKPAAKPSAPKAKKKVGPKVGKAPAKPQNKRAG